MTSKEYLAALLPKMQGMDVAHRAMMGGYLIYYNSKYIACICGDKFLIKATDSAKRILPDAPLEYPYEGSRTLMRVVPQNIDSLSLLELFEAVYPEVPEPKKKKV